TVPVAIPFTPFYSTAHGIAAGRRQSIHVEDCGLVSKTVGRDAVTVAGAIWPFRIFFASQKTRSG
ncbi:MAG: hypothetical protein P8H69_02920, partial [Planktomarina sp.]|nr:hypothetical protein [Planktomarina sp.]